MNIDHGLALWKGWARLHVYSIEIQTSKCKSIFFSDFYLYFTFNGFCMGLILNEGILTFICPVLRVTTRGNLLDFRSSLYPHILQNIPIFECIDKRVKLLHKKKIVLLINNLFLHHRRFVFNFFLFLTVKTFKGVNFIHLMSISLVKMYFNIFIM